MNINEAQNVLEKINGNEEERGGFSIDITSQRSYPILTRAEVSPLIHP